MKKISNNQQPKLYILPLEPYRNVIVQVIIEVFSKYNITLDIDYLKSKPFKELADKIVHKAFYNVILNDVSNFSTQYNFNHLHKANIRGDLSYLNVNQDDNSDGYEYYICLMLSQIDSSLLDKFVYWDNEYFDLSNVIIDDITVALDNNHYLNSIIIPEFKEPYSEWRVKLTNTNIIVEYVGDYRIRRYHEIFGNGFH